MLSEDELQKLLRLKRYERPPEGYFDDFLVEFQRRQRTEMLKQPLWRIVVDRINAALGEISAPRMAYGFASAAVAMVGGIMVFQIMTRPVENNGAIASRPSVAISPGTTLVSTTPQQQQSPVDGAMSLRPNIELPNPLNSQRMVPAAFSRMRPAYVIDARPVSYEEPTTF